MKFCSNCGQKITRQVPDGDDRLRHVCIDCNIVHYQNPQTIVGFLPTYQNKILLCRRAIEPRKAYWTLPAGFLENGETTLAGAERETWEEALAKVKNNTLYRIFDLPNINQIYIFYRGDLIDGNYGVGQESIETTLFDESEIPWAEIAFSTVSEILKEYFSDRKTGLFPVRISEITST